MWRPIRRIEDKEMVLVLVEEGEEGERGGGARAGLCVSKE